MKQYKGVYRTGYLKSREVKYMFLFSDYTSWFKDTGKSTERSLQNTSVNLKFYAWPNNISTDVINMGQLAIFK